MSQTNAQNTLPLFFKNPQPLNAARHGKAGVAPIRDFRFAQQTNAVPLNAVEFFEACKHYPIVFLGEDKPIPVAIMGLEKSNYFVGRSGQWKEAAYIPAYVRKYPFLFVEVPENKTLALCVDEGGPFFRAQASTEAPPLFDGLRPSSFSSQALEFCKTYHHHHLSTQAFCEELGKSGVLSPSQSSSKLKSGREVQMGGFMVVDEKKLAALPDATVLDFHKRGILPLLYATLFSANNWNILAEMASQLEPKAA